MLTKARKIKKYEFSIEKKIDMVIQDAK